MNIIVAPSLYEQIKEYDRTPKSVKVAQARQVDDNGQPLPQKSYESKIGKPDYIFTQDDIPNLDLGVQRNVIQEICQSSAKKRSKLLKRNFIADKYLAAENCIPTSPTEYSYVNLLSENTRNNLTLDGHISGYDAASKMFMTGASNSQSRYLLIYCFKDVWVGMYIDFLKDVFESNATLAKYVVMFKRPATKKKLLEKIQFTVDGIQYIKRDVDFSNFEFVTHSDGNEYVRYAFDLTRNSSELETHAHLINTIHETGSRCEAWVHLDNVRKKNPEYHDEHFHLLSVLFSNQELGYSTFVSRLNLFGLKLFTPFISEMSESNYVTKNYILDSLISIETHMSLTNVCRYGFLTFAPSLKPSISDAFVIPCSQMLKDFNEFDSNKLIQRMGDMLKAEFIETILGTIGKEVVFPQSDWKNLPYEDQRKAIIKSNIAPRIHSIVGIDTKYSTVMCSKWHIYCPSKTTMNTVPAVDGTFQDVIANTFELIDSFIAKINTPAMRAKLHKMFAPLFQVTEKEVYVLAELNKKKSVNSFYMGRYQSCADFIYLFAKSGLTFHAAWPDAPLDLYQKIIGDSAYPIVTLLNDFIEDNHASIFNHRIACSYSKVSYEDMQSCCPDLEAIFNSQAYKMLDEFKVKGKYELIQRTRSDDYGIMPQFMQYIQDKIAPATLIKWIEESVLDSDMARVKDSSEREYYALRVFSGRQSLSRHSQLSDAIQMAKQLIDIDAKTFTVSKNVSCEKFHDAAMNHLLEHAKDNPEMNSIVLPSVLIPRPIKVQNDAFQYRSGSAAHEDHDENCLTIKDAVWEVIQPPTMQYLKSWSKLVSNCVGTSSNYAEDIKNKMAFIVLMKINGKPRITIQMNLKGQELNIVQIKDTFNGHLTQFKVDVVKKVLNKALRIVADQLAEA